jgi:enoyl-CoA hydratase/carnithine racemase
VNTLSVERDGPIVHVQLQRPEKLNAQTHEMWFELRQLGAELGQDRAIRALIVSGAGRSFSAGLDTSVLVDFFGSDMAEDLKGLNGSALVRKVQESFTWLANAPYPTIAAAAAEGQVRCLASKDLIEAGAAWMEKREPVYTGS